MSRKDQPPSGLAVGFDHPLDLVKVIPTLFEKKRAYVIQIDDAVVKRLTSSATPAEPRSKAPLGSGPGMAYRIRMRLQVAV